jgi:hypothetical protein
MSAADSVTNRPQMLTVSIQGSANAPWNDRDGRKTATQTDPPPSSHGFPSHYNFW